MLVSALALRALALGWIEANVVMPAPQSAAKAVAEVKPG